MTKKEIELIESLLNAIEAERTADYGGIDDSWANAKMTMSDSVYDAWNEKTCAVYIRAEELRKYLTSFIQEKQPSCLSVVIGSFLSDLDFIIDNMGYDLVKDKVSKEAQQEYLKRLKMMRLAFFTQVETNGAKSLEALMNMQGMLDDVSEEEFNKMLKSMK